MTKDKYIEFANKTLERWVAEDGYIYYKANLQGLEALCKLAAAQDKLLDDDDTLTIAYQSGYYDGKKAAQPAQKPVAYLCKPDQHGLFAFPTPDKACKDCFPVYTALPQRPWVGLTDEEIDQGLVRTNYAMQTAGAWRDGVEWAQSQLKEKK